MLKLPRKGIETLSITLAGFLLLLPLAKIFSLHSTLYDLGIFESLLYRISTINEWQSIFSGHVQWFALPYGWLYGLLPLNLAPYFLVGTQTIFLLLPAFWFYRRFGTLPAFAYVAYYPLWVNAHFDFHFDHLAVPLLLGFYWALLDQRIGWAVFSATLLMFVKEPFALQTVACGVLLLWASIHRKSIWEQSKGQVSQRWLVVGALWLIGVGLGYFYLVMHYIFPYFSLDSVPLELGSGAFSWLGNGLKEMIQTIITNPHVIFWDIITTPRKLIYLGELFSLLAFISLLRPVFLIPALPLFAVAMLSHLPNYYDPNTHYTAGLIVPVIIAFVHGMPRAEQIWERLLVRVRKNWRVVSGGGKSGFNPGLPSKGDYSPLSQLSQVERDKGFSGRLGGALDTFEGRKQFFYIFLFVWILVGHMLLSPSPISRLFWLDKGWTQSWRTYVPTKRDAMLKTAMEKYIPAEPDVSVTTQNTLNWGHLAHRKIYLPFPLNVAEPHKMMDWSNRTLEGFVEFVRTGYKPPAIRLDRYADFVALDLRRPYFLEDHGCRWVEGKCTNNKKMEKEFVDWVAYTRSLYDTVFEQDGFMILQRSET